MSVVVAQERTVGAIPAGTARWVYLGEDPAWRLRAERGVLQSLERVVTRERLQRHSQELRQPYLDWIADLGARNDSLEWWASELAAKNVYTFLFQRVCAVAVAMDVIADDMLVVCPTPAFARTVTTLARERGLATEPRIGRPPTIGRVRDMAFRAYHGLPRSRPAPAEPASGDTLLVTWVDDRNFDEAGNYRDPHFGPLADMLRAQGHEVSLLARVLPTKNPRRTRERLAACGERVYLPDAYLTPGDWRRASKRVRAAAPLIADDAQVAGVPTALLARELLAQTRMSHTGALTYEPLISRMAAAGTRPSAIVVPWEGHAWETALFGAARRHLPGTALIAYDNLNFSSLALSLYPGAAELGVRPLPDRVVTNGETFARLLSQRGFPRDRIRVGCALRHGYLYAEHVERPVSAGRPYVLAAGSIDAAQTIEMVDVAYAAFGSEMVVKLHPASDISRIRAASPRGVQFSERGIGDLLSSARAMIYTYSIVPYEALAAGVPPIFFQSQSLLDLDQLEPSPDVRWVGATAQDLSAAVRDAELAVSETGWSERALDVLRAALAPPATDCAGAFIAPA